MEGPELAMQSNMCILCEGNLHDKTVVTVGSKRILSIIQASMKRRDNIHRMARGLTSLVVHVHCNKKYTNKKSISACVRTIATGTSTSRTTSKSTAEFKFNQLCVFCSSDASDDFVRINDKKPISRREIVRIITKESTHEGIMKMAANRHDDYGMEIFSRMSLLTTLPLKSLRYHDSCIRPFRSSSSSSNITKECDSQLSKVIAHIKEYLENNREECQFSLGKVMESFDADSIPKRELIKAKLLETYGDDIIIANSSNKQPVISFRDSAHLVLSDNFYKKRLANDEDERARIVSAAAQIIVEDIRSKVYTVDSFPSPDSFLDDINNDIPNTLKLFLESVILKNKRGNVAAWHKKITCIAHSMISATRPQSFFSPLQMGLATMLNKRYGSKDLLNLLSAFGFCSSYYDFQLFETSLLMNPNTIEIVPPSYSQFVFDNADHNVRTLDGYNTFHSMGGIQCVTPSSSVKAAPFIPKLRTLPKASVVGNFGYIPLQKFQRSSSNGLANVQVANLEVESLSRSLHLTCTDFLWIYGKNLTGDHTGGWNSFMQKMYNHISLEKSKVLFLSFVNAPPSDYDTIYTVLLEASEKGKSLNQGHVFVTFDQPLYWKAREIVECRRESRELENVIVRLGGFHLLMSFLGSIGFIMNGSGFKELLNQIYASASIDKILNGHAYARAVRAHTLVHVALGKIILSSLELTDEEKSFIKCVLENVDTSYVLDDINDAKVQNIFKKYTYHVQQLAENGRTSQLWVQYYSMVSLMKQFIEAERSGNWYLHLNTITKMLPYFHASGHYLYAKSAHLYVQDMSKLSSVLSNAEFDKFTDGSYFTIKRSDKGWSGVWSDMVIEQTLMKLSKDFGGLTHGRGVSDSVLTKWTMSMTPLLSIIDAVRDFANVSYHTSEQHIDATTARVLRDDKDIKKFEEWLLSHPPFPITEDVICIGTGIKGSDAVNSYDAVNVGLSAMKKLQGKNFKNLQFTHKSKVITLHAFNSVKVRGSEIAINPTCIFQRICLLKKSDEELKNYFSYELAPYPLALFNESGMRKCQKSKLYDVFNCLTENPNLENHVHVVDGGFFLHRVVWHEKENFQQIINRYVQYAQKHYAQNSIIIFDGYSCSNDNSTKSNERQRRFLKNAAPDIVFTSNTVPSISQEKFLSNSFNKNRLIDELIIKLRESSFQAHQAVEDADADIVRSALQACKTNQTVVIVSEDIDVLILLTQFTKDETKCYFYKPSKGTVIGKFYTSASFKYQFLKHFIAFIHAFTGCDTTCAFYNQGKSKFMKILVANPHLQSTIDTFNNSEAVPDIIDRAGQQLIKAAYGLKSTDSCTLNELRYRFFCKSALRHNSNLAALPPTQDAARQHSLRVYHQLRKWQGEVNDPLQWGWKRNMTGLEPLTMTADAVPLEILKIISCKCKKGCNARCSCRKVGLKCTNMCANCHGTDCRNIDVKVLSDSDEEDDDTDENVITSLYEDLTHNINPLNIEESSDEESNCTDVE